MSYSWLAAITSSGDAVPVPFFMIVIDATRFPNRAASTADPVTASVIAAPAEKLSPAPQISTGFSTALPGTIVWPRSSITNAPSPPNVTINDRAEVCSRSAA